MGKSDPDKDVVVLHQADQLQLDPGPLTRLFAEKQPMEAEDVLCQALEVIAVQLDRIQSVRNARKFDELNAPTRRVALVAAKIGLTEVALAAEHVANCVQQRNGVALDATIARLERGFDVAVTDVWSFRS